MRAFVHGMNVLKSNDVSAYKLHSVLWYALDKFWLTKTIPVQALNYFVNFEVIVRQVCHLIVVVLFHFVSEIY